MLIDGTSNLTTTLNAYGFAAKGHYLQLSPLAVDAKPFIGDKNNVTIEPDSDADDTFLGIEPFSGVCLVAMERIFMNLAIYGDDLFQNFSPPIPEDYGYFFPLAYIKRESVWTQDQVDAVFGPLVLGQKLKWAFFSLLLIFGLGFFALCVWFFFRYRKLHNEVYPEGDLMTIEEASASLNAQGLLGNTPTEGSENDFDTHPPSITPQERPFSLIGQGKPIAELSDFTDTTSGGLAGTNSGGVPR